MLASPFFCSHLLPQKNLDKCLNLPGLLLNLSYSTQFEKTEAKINKYRVSRSITTDILDFFFMVIDLRVFIGSFLGFTYLKIFYHWPWLKNS